MTLAKAARRSALRARKAAFAARKLGQPSKALDRSRNRAALRIKKLARRAVRKVA